MATPKKANPQRAGRKQKVNAEIAKKLETAAAWSYSKLQMALYA